MSPLQTLLSLWNWTSLAPLVAIGLFIADFVANGWRRGHRSAFLFIAGAGFVLAYVSPVGVLANGYLFSAHVIQHLILLLVVPLCYLLSLPAQETRSCQAGKPDLHGLSPPAAQVAGDRASCPASWMNRTPFLDTSRLAALLSVPQIGWLCGLGVMWLWHVPSLCHAAAQTAGIGVLRDATLLGAGIAFWWPILSPVFRQRLAPPIAALYLFSACFGCTLLGIYITFTPISVCPVFAHPVDRLGVVPLLHEMGLTHATDQRLGGLLMWVPPCLVYGGVIISVLCRWYTPAGSQVADPVSGAPLLVPIGDAHR